MTIENKRNKVQNFHKRWNIEYNKEKMLNEFKNSVLTTINTTVAN